MKIVLDLQAAQSLSRHRGIGRYTLAMARAFVQASSRHETHLALNGHDPGRVEELIGAFDGLLPRNRIGICELPPNIPAHDRSNREARQRAGAIYADFLNGFGADYIWHGSLFEGWGDDTATSLGTGNDDHHHLSTFYDLIPLRYPEKTFVNAWHRDWYYQRLALLKRCRTLFAISEFSRRQAMDLLQIPAHRIVNISGAALETFAPSPMTDSDRARWARSLGLGEEYLLYVGGYDPHKNVETLIAAYAMLPEPLRKHYPLVLAGHCSHFMQASLTALGHQYGLVRNQLLFTGSVTDEELAQLYTHCSGFVAPSLHEGLGLPALEAMACGAPVVGSGTTSLHEVIGLSEAMFDPRSPSMMSCKLHQMLADTGFADTLRDNARRQTQTHTWQNSAQRVLDALEQLHSEDGKQAPARARPRLLVVSPVPPVRSGVADYVARSLRELGNLYEVELVADQPEVTDIWTRANFTIRDWKWLLRQEKVNARILYHFGNSPPHAHMFELLQRHPGVVMLHDSLLGAVRNWMAEQAQDETGFLETLHAHHGYQALKDDAREGRTTTIDTYPMTADVIRDAQAILVHSRHAVDLATHFFGEQVAGKFEQIPFPVQTRETNRRAARNVLGFKQNDLVICSFGMMAPTKLNHRLITAWARTSLADRPDCHLVFVGEAHGGEYGGTIHDAIGDLPGTSGIHITGFVTQETYTDYLNAADIAVQLRTHSRGETSAAIFDVLSHKLATIVNAHGTASELPDSATVKIADRFHDEELAWAMEQLASDPAKREHLAAAAQDHVAQEHDPGHVAMLYRNTIERVSGRRRTNNPPFAGLPRLFIDVTEAGSLNTRIATGLLALKQNRFRIEPVHMRSGQVVHATEFAIRALSLEKTKLPETPATPNHGDLFLRGWQGRVEQQENDALPREWQAGGVRTCLIQDKGPVSGDGETQTNADAVLCLDKSGAQALQGHLESTESSEQSDTRLGYICPQDSATAEPPDTIGAIILSLLTRPEHPQWLN